MGSDDALEPFAPDIWTAARPLRFWRVETGTRMSVVRLSGGGLFVLGPVALDEATRRAVDALGPVRAVVASSLFHHLYVGDWMSAYPEAVFCACPGLEKKRADLPWTHVLGDEPLDVWADDLEQVYFSARFEHEIVFFHRVTRSLLCLDAMLNLSEHPLPSTRLVARLMANTGPGKGYLERVAVRSRRDAREEVAAILRWDFDRATLAHGALVQANARDAFREAYAWVRPERATGARSRTFRTWAAAGRRRE